MSERARRQEARAQASRIARRRSAASSPEVERARRLEAQRLRDRQRRLQMGFYVFCLIALFAGYWYSNGLGVGSPVILGADVRAPDGSAIFAADVGKEVEPIGESDLRKNARQRELVTELARRHLGEVPRGGDLRDLAILQEIIDERILDEDQTYELQSLGVVLGDVLARQLELEWVVVDDRYGSSRALQYGVLDDYFFPITMISRRYEKNILVDVARLYENAKREVAALRRRGR